MSVISGSHIGEGDLRTIEEIIWDPPDSGAMVTGSNQRRQGSSSYNISGMLHGSMSNSALASFIF